MCGDMCGDTGSDTCHGDGGDACHDDGEGDTGSDTGAGSPRFWFNYISEHGTLVNTLH